LCFWFEQITRTTPRRRTILHLSHIRFTDALTFISHGSQLPAASFPVAGRSQLFDDPASRQIARR